MISKNYIPTHRLAARQRRLRLRLWATVLVGYGTALAVVYIVCFGLWSVDSKGIQTQLGEIEARIEHTGQRITATQAQFQTADLILKVNQAVSNQPDWSGLLVLLASELDDDVVLRHCQLIPQKEKNSSIGSKDENRLAGQKNQAYVLKLVGYGRTQAAVSRFILDLEQTGLFEKVKLIRTNRERFLSDDAVAFNAQCLLGKQEGPAK